MEPVSLALAGRIVGLLQPIAARKFDDFARAVGSATVDKAIGLLELVRTKLSGDPAAGRAIEDFEAEPESKAGTLTQTLAARMDADPALADELSARVADIGPTLVVRMHAGHVETQTGPKVGDIRRGRVDVSISADTAGSQSGGEFGNIG